MTSVIVPRARDRRRARRDERVALRGPGARTVDITFAVTLAAAFVSPWTGVRVGGFPLSDLTMGVALVLLVASMFLRRPQVRLPLVSVIPTVVLLIMILVNVVARGMSLVSVSTQLLYQYTQGSSVTAGVTGAGPMLARFVLSTVVVAFAVSVFGALYGRDRLRVLLQAWVLGTAVSALAAAIEPVISLRGTPFLFASTTVDRAIGLSFHPNSLAQSMSLALPTMLYFALDFRGMRRLGMAAIVALTVYADYKSGSRAGLLVGSAGLLLTWVVLMIQSKRFVAGTMSLLAGALAALTLLPAVLSKTRFNATDTSAQTSTALRSGILQNGWDLFAHNPLIGSGVGIWMGENVPLIMLTSGGIILLLGYYAPFFEVLLRVSPHHRDPLAALTLLTLLVLFTYGFLNNGFGERYLFWPIYIGYEMFRHRTDRPVDGWLARRIGTTTPDARVLTLR